MRPTLPNHALAGLALVFMSAAFAPFAALADEPENGGPENGGTFSFQWENDKVADTDRHYTNGLRIAYTFNRPQGQWQTTGLALADLAHFQSSDDLRVGWVVGQNMYTPEDVDRYTPDPTDRPYAGWSYAGISLQNDGANLQDTLDLNIGIIGPASNAAQTQNAFHRLINVSTSRGWHSQINNELGLLATRMIKYRSEAVELTDLAGGVETDVIGHATAQLGNVQTSAALGATVRLGGNLGEDFGPVYNTFALPAKRPSKPTYSLFFGGEGRAVAWDAFLDGNAFRESPDVKKESFVLEARLGVGVHWPLEGWTANTLGARGVRTNLQLVQRSREFVGQGKADRYGSLQVMLNF